MCMVSEKQRSAAAVGEANWRGTGTALVVDDDEFILRLIGRLLGMLGLSSLPAKSGAEALDIYRQNGHDICFIILDLSMPEMSGAELARAIWMINPKAKIIVCSGYSEQQASRYFNDSDKINFLKKPFKLEDIEAELRKLMTD